MAEEFSKRIFARAAHVGQRASELTQKAGLAIDQTVVIATPINTGRARSNWRVAINQSPQGEIPPYQPGEGGSTTGPNTDAALAQGRAAIASYKPGDTSIHITNNVAYIGDLNRGTSAQAPANFIEEAIHAGVRSVQGLKILED